MGGVGIHTVLGGRFLDVGTVIRVDISNFKLRLARELADVAIDPKRKSC